MHGAVFDIQRFSTDDGKGIRTCVFLKGCPLSCRWCHNIESQNFHKELAYYPQNCIGCGACVLRCPNGCHTLINGCHHFDRTNCIVCGACTDTCYAEALVTIGEEKTVEQVMEIVRRDRPFYRGVGGITVTGGEPMAQFSFTYALAMAAKQEHLSFVLETSGYGRTEDFVKLAPLCDCFLFDCKASAQQHRELIGTDDSLILHNLDVLAKQNAHIVLRCPIVKGGNLTREFLDKIAKLATQYPQISHVQLMPYHTTGAEKAQHLGFEGQQIFEVPDKDLLSSICDYIQTTAQKPVFW